MKVQIGSKYSGPSLDRPCLRQMPREWELEETKKPPTNWSGVGSVLFWLAFLLVSLQMIRRLL